jgi:hypothetical protein
MASKATTYTRGEMDIHAQAATFDLVMKLIKWGSLAVAVLLLLPILWFCTDAGFLGAAISSLVVLVLGVVFLRDKGGAH